MDIFTENMYRFWKEIERSGDNGIVKINKEKLKETAFEWAMLDPNVDLRISDWQIPGVLPKDHDAFVSHLFYQSAVNFAFTNFAPPYEKFRIGKFCGSEAMGNCFYRAFGENPISPEDILSITDSEESMNYFFSGDAPIPMINEKRRNLKLAAQILIKRFGGDPFNILEEANYRTTANPKIPIMIGLTDWLVKEFPIVFGEDCYSPTLRFDKRPRLFALMYHSRAVHSKEELEPLADPKNIGPIIDYQIPNALRHLGILSYSEPIREFIEKRAPIQRHSDIEIMIRLATTCAMTELLKEINEEKAHCDLSPITMANLDPKLWKIGRSAAKNPHHLCITTDY